MSVFRFKEFTIRQKNSAMKVGTDGVLLGSWVSCSNTLDILDIGCGTGLISLMLAQRAKDSKITCIEIDKLTSQEAEFNIKNSAWTDRIKVKNISLQEFNSKKKFSLIVSNPPFFPASNFNDRRNVARRTNTLSFHDLIEHSRRLLAKNGRLCYILPIEYFHTFCDIAKLHHLYLSKVCYIKGNVASNVKRVMIEFSDRKSKLITENLTIELSRHKYTNDYIRLCRDFYLGM